MTPLLLSGSAHPAIASALALALGVEPGRVLLERFPDGEQHVVVQAPVRGREVVLVQSLRPPAGEALLELALLADACHRAGAAALTGVLPYVAYARQDRRGQEGEALGARVLTELLGTARLSRVLAVDLHTEALEGCFTCPLEHLSALEALLPALRPFGSEDAVVVSPDLGGVKRAERFARALALPLAVVHKTRRSPSEVYAERIVGDVAGRRPLLVDDLVSTGATLEAAVRALRGAGCLPDVTVVATHALLAGDAAGRLRRAGVSRLLTTDSVPTPPQLPLPVEVVSLAPLLAGALQRVLGAGPHRLHGPVVHG